MIQARIPDAILRQLPVGTPTGGYLRMLRDGQIDRCPPALIAWARRNGFDAGEAVELLPAIVPAPPASGATFGSSRYRDDPAMLIGALLQVGSLTVPFLFGIAWTNGHKPPSGSIAGLDSVAMTLGLGAALWGSIQLSPVLALPIFALFLQLAGRVKAGTIGDEAAVWFGVLLAQYWAIVAGYGLIARAKGYSMWTGFLGVFSLCLFDRNRP